MPSFFARHTGEWQLEEPAAFRKLSVSLLEMALLAGVTIRLYRAILLGLAAPAGWLTLGIGFAIGAIFLLGMAAAHLGNFSVHRWLWRAPAFGALVGVAEALTGLALIALRREPLGSARATFSDWPSMALSTVVTRTIVISVFAIVLAAVAQGVRLLLVRRENRAHTLRAVHSGEPRQERPGHDGAASSDAPR